MKKSLLSIVAATTLFTSVASADFLGLEIGAAGWSPEMTGKFQYSGTNMDLKDNLGYGDTESASYMWLSFEHPVPVIPNVKIIQTNLEMDASKTSAIDLTFAGQTYTTSESVASGMTLNQTDYILYYEFSEGLIIPFVHLDAGFAIKDLEGTLYLNSTTIGKSEKDFSVPVPMGYVKVKLSTSAIPFIPFLPDIEYETLFLSIGDNSFEDTKIGIVYNFELAAGFDAGLVAGLREETLEVDEAGVKANVEISGYYYGAYFNW